MANFTPRPTIYKGIQMRSRLEAGFAAWLDRVNLSWEYEPHALANEHGQYLPDFLVRDCLTFVDSNEWGDVYIELKPTTSVIDWARIQQARDVCRRAITDGNNGLFVVVIADMGTYFPVQDAPLSVEHWNMVPMAWVDCDRQVGGSKVSSAALTFLSPHQPFPREWWK